MLAYCALMGVATNGIVVIHEWGVGAACTCVLVVYLCVSHVCVSVCLISICLTCKLSISPWR